MPEYIACAFLTLYLTRCANLRVKRIRDVKPAEYFKLGIGIDSPIIELIENRFRID